MIQIKTDDEIVLMRAAGLVVGRTLEALAAAAAPGITTGELDALAESMIRSAGAVPSFLGYRPHPSIPPFPGSICASVNDEIVHGVPGPRVLRDGDIISIDCGAILAGWHGDAAVTVGVGTVSETARELMRVTEESMWHGLAAARLGGRLTDISHAVETYARSQGDYGIVEEYGGHGIGRAMHMDPHVSHVARAQTGHRIREGMAFTVEPMVNAGSAAIRTDDDGWTVRTTDGALSAQFEHTVIIGPHGPEITTLT